MFSRTKHAPSRQDDERAWVAMQEQLRWYAENELPPYDPAEQCPKCGWNDVLTIHKPGHTPSINYPGACATPERFERRCSRCTHAWWEQVPVERREFRPCWRTNVDCILRVGHKGDHEPRA